MDSPIDGFAAACDTGDSDFYYSGNPDGYKLSWSVKWMENKKDGMRRYTVYNVEDWVDINTLSSDLITKFLTDISLRTEPGQEPDAARAAELLALSDDTESKRFINACRDRLPIQVWFMNPPPSKYIFKVDGNVDAWLATTWSESNPSMFWDKYKAIRT